MTTTKEDLEAAAKPDPPAPVRSSAPQAAFMLGQLHALLSRLHARETEIWQHEALREIIAEYIRQRDQLASIPDLLDVSAPEAGTGELHDAQARAAAFAELAALLRRVAKRALGAIEDKAAGAAERMRAERGRR